MKPDFVLTVFHKTTMSPAFCGHLLDPLVSGGVGAIAVMLSVLMRGAWLVRQRVANSGWVDAALALVLPRHRRAVRLADGREWGVSHYRMKAAS